MRSTGRRDRDTRRQRDIAKPGGAESRKPTEEDARNETRKLKDDAWPLYRRLLVRKQAIVRASAVRLELMSLAAEPTRAPPIASATARRCRNVRWR
ncbi:hypothetical protein AX14_010968, partial [Amanita brunnescens Koide BX004]